MFVESTRVVASAGEDFMYIMYVHRLESESCEDCMALGSSGHRVIGRDHMSL